MPNYRFRISQAPFYNEVIFGKPPGSSNGIAWSAYSGLISFIAGFVHDAVIGGLAFSRALSTSGMTVFWVIEMLTGAGLFASLYVIDDKFDALLGTSTRPMAPSNACYSCGSWVDISCLFVPLVYYQ